MYKIEYDVSLNEDGRPCIELSSDYEQRPEDKFFIMELARYMFSDILYRNRNSNKLDNETIEALENSENLMTQLSDEVAKILYDGMKINGDINIMTNPFQVLVSSISERDLLPTNGIHYNKNIYDRCEGLKVKISESDEIYELKGGISNEHWTKL